MRRMDCVSDALPLSGGLTTTTEDSYKICLEEGEAVIPGKKLSVFMTSDRSCERTAVCWSLNVRMAINLGLASSRGFPYVDSTSPNADRRGTH